jgi:hypothetical protein
MRQQNPITKLTEPHKITSTIPTITLERLHNRFGHVPFNLLLLTRDSELWQPIKLQWEPDKFCVCCKMGNIRAKDRGKNPVSSPTRPGEIQHLDIVYNPLHLGLSSSLYNPYYLGITDAYSHAYFLIGMKSIEAKSNQRY